MPNNDSSQLGSIQHYVPRSYLKRFSVSDDSDQVYAYEVGRDPYITNVKNVASEKDYYTFLDPETNKKSDELEKALSGIDEEGARLLTVLDTLPLGYVELNKEDRGNLLSYISFLRARNVRSKRESLDMLKKAQIIQLQFVATNKEIYHRDAKKAMSKKYNYAEAESSRISLLNGEIDIAYDKDDQYFMGAALEHSKELYVVLYKMKRILLFENNTSRYFITSDNPVSRYAPEDHDRSRGVGHVHAIFQLPISPTRCVLLVNEDMKVKNDNFSCSRANVDHMNWYTYHAAEKWIFSNIKSGAISDMMNTHNSKDTGIVFDSPFGKLPKSR